MTRSVPTSPSTPTSSSNSRSRTLSPNVYNTLFAAHRDDDTLEAMAQTSLNLREAELRQLHNTALEKERLRPKKTTNSYNVHIQGYARWLTKKGYQDPFVNEERILVYLDECLIGKKPKKRGRKSKDDNNEVEREDGESADSVKLSSIKLCVAALTYLHKGKG